MQKRVRSAVIPPPLAVIPELTDEEIDWLNDQMALTDNPPVRYARALPSPWAHIQVPSGPAPGGPR